MCCRCGVAAGEPSAVLAAAGCLPDDCGPGWGGLRWCLVGIRVLAGPHRRGGGAAPGAPATGVPAAQPALLGVRRAGRRPARPARPDVPAAVDRPLWTDAVRGRDRWSA